MYPIDEAMGIVSLDSIPAHSAGAPMPLVLADDVALVLAYETAPSGDNLAIVRFVDSRAHLFGPPGDETLHGHPLAERGLRPYGVFEVLRSTWISELERLNRVHVRHDSRRYAALRHFVFTFHDNTFECVARSIRVVSVVPNDLDNRRELLKLMAGQLIPDPNQN
jgi:hypothetical protein